MGTASMCQLREVREISVPMSPIDWDPPKEKPPQINDLRGFWFLSLVPRKGIKVRTQPHSPGVW